jgi:hypothetical protein
MHGLFLSSRSIGLLLQELWGKVAGSAVMTDRIDFGGRPWHAIPRDALRDPRLSLKGRGALVTLLSHEEGWVRSSIATLMREARCGRDAAKAAMAELREAGYAEIITERDLEGHLRRHYVIFAESRAPASSSPQTSGNPGDGKPIGRETHRTGNPANEVEAPDVEALDVRNPSLSFDDFYEAFPRHEGKGAAKKAYAKALSKASAEALLSGAVRYGSDPNREPGFTCLPATWLNQERWDDDPLPPRRAGPAAFESAGTRILRKIARQGEANGNGDGGGRLGLPAGTGLSGALDR